MTNDEKWVMWVRYIQIAIVFFFIGMAYERSIFGCVELKPDKGYPREAYHSLRGYCCNKKTMKCQNKMYYNYLF